MNFYQRPKKKVPEWLLVTFPPKEKIEPFLPELDMLMPFDNSFISGMDLVEQLFAEVASAA